MKTVLIFLLPLLVLAACAPASGGVSLGAADAGTTVALKTGDTLTIALEGNVTTGYTWVAAPPDPPVLAPLGEAEVTPAGPQIGAPGLIVLRFSAAAPGTAVLRLEYRRPWESLPPEKTFEVTVVVE